MSYFSSYYVKIGRPTQNTPEGGVKYYYNWESGSIKFPSA